MRVLIADGQAVYRRGLREILAQAFSNVSIGEASTAQDALKYMRRKNWDVLILDISMPAKGGLGIVDDLRRLRPKLPILLLSARPEQFAQRTVEAGAAAYLTKDCSPGELNQAIRTIVRGGRYVGASVNEKLAADLRNAANLPLYELLSDREFQVLQMIASGKAVKEIAEELSLSIKTVSTYRARILAKTGMKTNAELIRYALQTHLVD